MEVVTNPIGFNQGSPVQGKDFPGTIKKFHREGGRLYFDADNSKLEVRVISDEILRFRV
ncbi:MAG: hypothetical protein IPI23_14790 [Bacteroidetes bacterium]|nr:hypothetical protein [Bacteroidota bacterium]